jgi:HSP20 family protein
LTPGQQKHSVNADLGFFSSPEYNGSYLNHPSPRKPARPSRRLMNTITRRDQSRGLTLQDEVNRLFDDNFTRERSGHADLAMWAPAVDIYETENELVVKAELPDFQDKDIDVRITNNTLTIRGERKFETGVKEENYLRIERAYGSFMRSFSLPNTVNSENIRADYRNGILTLHMAKREESKPKQIKVSVAINGK